MCVLRYGVAPRIIVTDQAKPFPFLPRYLFYILSELLKNSVRATVEAHQGFPEASLPDITVLVSGDEEHCCCRVSDQGGGIPVRSLTKVWSYFYTTAQPIESTVSRTAVDAPEDMAWLLQKQAEADLGDKEENEQKMLESPLAGLGCGLPLCRLYAEYLGGSIELQTMPKYGTDVFVNLSRLAPGRLPEEAAFRASPQAVE